MSDIKQITEFITKPKKKARSNKRADLRAYERERYQAVVVSGV